jgi:hypothetical protein
MASDDEQVAVKDALTVSRILWPEFVEEHGCVFLGWHSGSNPPPASDTMTGWESFINHTHIFDEFANEATAFVSEDVVYNEHHPDFLSASELGKQIAKLWALKLKLDFPFERFRVYYTEYDNPIVRFHKVRDDEPCWITDEVLQTEADSLFRNAVIYDTSRISLPSGMQSNALH